MRFSTQFGNFTVFGEISISKQIIQTLKVVRYAEKKAFKFSHIYLCFITRKAQGMNFTVILLH